MRNVRLWIGGGVLLMAALAACSAAPAQLPDAETLLTKAGNEVEQASSIRIKLQLTGAPSFVDPPTTPGGPGNQISFVSADGVYVAPDRISATVVAKILGVPGQVQVVAIGNDQWMKAGLLTAGKWVKEIFSPGFNAGDLVSSGGGIQAALHALKEVKLVGHESVDGVDMYHITATAAGTDVAALTVGLIRGNVVNLDIYIPVATGRVDRVIMLQPDTVTDKEPQPTTWTLELFNYNAPAQVPIPGASSATTEATAAQ